jgi:3-oxoacyl-[acyl-carrier protein] reductase
MPDRSGWDRKPGFDLIGKDALVVGAETATGTAIARALVEAGASVAAVAATGTAGQLDMLRGDVNAPGRRGHIDVWDMRDPDAVRAGFERLVQEFGAPTVLVTAADAPYSALIEDTDDRIFRQTMGIIVEGTYYACRAFLKALPADATSARIICLTTVFGERGVDATSAYATAHGAVHNLVRALAQETGARGVTVNAIATGWMTDTPGRGPDEIGQNRLMRFIPMRRFGAPDEVAPLAVLLASEAAGNISGQILHVDGGITTHL